VTKEPMIGSHNYGWELLNISIEISVTVSVHLKSVCCFKTAFVWDTVFCFYSSVSTDVPPYVHTAPESNGS